MKRMRGPVGRPSSNKKISHPEIAERIQTVMENRGMTRRDMVRSLGCTDAVFGNYYNGLRIPHGKYANKISDLLGITVDYLLYGKGEAPRELIREPNEEEKLDYLIKMLQSIKKPIKQ